MPMGAMQLYGSYKGKSVITKDELAARFIHATEEVIAAEDTLTEIDSHFGDADHGLTMVKIANAIKGAIEDADGGIQEMLDDVAMAVMVLNGGSAVPLWNTWLDGLQEVAPEGDEADTEQLKTMFANALSELADISGAEVGDKTMMDAVIPASEAIAAYSGDEAGLFAVAAQAAEQGAENSKNFVSKFGRAKVMAKKLLARLMLERYQWRASLGDLRRHKGNLRRDRARA